MGWDNKRLSVKGTNESVKKINHRIETVTFRVIEIGFSENALKTFKSNLTHLRAYVKLKYRLSDVNEIVRY